MRKLAIVTASGVTGVVLAASIAAPVFAWHPKGEIKKFVTNQTQSGQMSDANDEKSAVAAKSGDTLKYTIVVSNTGAADSKGYNDMAKTKLTDTLPTGIELVSNPAQRTITEDLGLIKPGQKVTKEYLVKVVSAKDSDVITNKACFTGNSTANDNPQSGCDNAVVKVDVPKTPETPELPKETPTVLPNTGIGNIVLPAGVVSAVAYVGNLLRLKRRKG
jgi:uncharacterized repeat protein (TIGR01451 family)